MTEHVNDLAAMGEEKRRLLIVVHGRSADDLELRAAVDAVRNEGVPIDVRVTWEAGDASRFAKEAVERDFDVVVAAGGDGTLNEVVNGILATQSHPRTAMAVIPLGTANDFAASCGLTERTTLQALKLAAGGVVHPIDVGRMNGRYFLNVVSGGFGAEVTTNTPVEMKQVLGGAAYSLMGLLTAINFHPYEARLTAEAPIFEGLLLMIAVGNGRQSGGGYRVTPNALIDDGLLDLVLVPDADLPQWGAVYQEMSHPELHEHHYVQSFQVKSFLVETSDAFQMNLDGEPIHDTRFEFDVIEKCLPMILPSQTPLLSQPAASPLPNE